MSDLLKVILPSGSSRFVTGITKSDVSYNIYSTNAIKDTPENIAKLADTLNMDKALKSLVSIDHE